MTAHLIRCTTGMPASAVRILRTAFARACASVAGCANHPFFSRIARHRQLIFSYVRAPAGLSQARTAAR
ncbi:MAG TPA: hypothetical protein VN361_09995 [Oxalicibacterium sp.]|nr:hypothetical protein [Oxalicibacterium sp.]